ncbi:hypothetical protein BCV70DRAFT_64859 [Testicularia cyperi]|uniref:Uncharacterized protein n=1 Tax=Testicularia cyperi TaxID=1882483 RepID=A0A317XIX0_9BASI|nr:hypothetical protein BCV70DRAFT_64859 [Testicularia cyperi]
MQSSGLRNSGPSEGDRLDDTDARSDKPCGLKVNFLRIVRSDGLRELVGAQARLHRHTSVMHPGLPCQRSSPGGARGHDREATLLGNFRAKKSRSESRQRLHTENCASLGIDFDRPLHRCTAAPLHRCTAATVWWLAIRVVGKKKQDSVLAAFK